MKPQPGQKRKIVDALLESYRRGYFPMAEPAPPWNPSGPNQIYWPSPDPRGVLPLTIEHGLRIPARLTRRIAQRPFTIRFDTRFLDVMRGCALPRRLTSPLDEPGTWIDDTLIEWFSLLHEAGHAHSVEAYRRHPESGQGVLVGGVYGIAIGAAFFGESMFHLPRPRQKGGSRDPLDGTDASKICLVVLVEHLRNLGYQLFDTQMVTEHIARFGGREIPRNEYLRLLDHAAAGPDRWTPLQPIEQAST